MIVYLLFHLFSVSSFCSPHLPLFSPRFRYSILFSFHFPSPSTSLSFHLSFSVTLPVLYSPSILIHSTFFSPTSAIILTFFHPFLSFLHYQFLSIPESNFLLCSLHYCFFTRLYFFTFLYILPFPYSKQIFQRSLYNVSFSLPSQGVQFLLEYYLSKSIYITDIL